MQVALRRGARPAIEESDSSSEAAASTGDQRSATPRADSMRNKRPDKIPAAAWNRICDGVAFNEVREPYYKERGGANEVYVADAKGRRYKVDSYMPNKEIVSRKETQFSEIKESTVMGYLQELRRKYNPSMRILSTEGNLKKLPDYVGKNLAGVQVLEIPSQKNREVLEVFKKRALDDFQIMIREARL
ncbi:hypothetical protein [Actinocrispum wychmicini]|uniref:hypothetical protein n=1 Tax=Actinocrispum wychmicini TaxID=1213861 RepID=UPI00104D4089|nr:hypothetical protein [Actinocrispum wychmicini]